MYSDPWKSNECGMMFLAIIDGDNPDSLCEQELER